MYKPQIKLDTIRKT